MQTENITYVAGVDLGTTLVKAVILSSNHKTVGSAIKPTRGQFADCGDEALAAALLDAGLSMSDLSHISATGYASSCLGRATMRVTTQSSLARGTFLHCGEAVTVVDIGGIHVKVMDVQADGSRSEVRTPRKCAVGPGSFLDSAARRLDVHPSRMQDLANSALQPAKIGSYCSIFSFSEINECLREGRSLPDIAHGCIQSVAERIFELGGFGGKVVAAGGVSQYYPGVIKTLSALIHAPISVLPECMFICAQGAAVSALS